MQSAAAVPFQSMRLHERALSVAGQAVIATVLIATWWLIPERFASSRLISRPPQVFAALLHIVANGTLATAVSESLVGLVLALCIAAPLGVAVAAISSTSSTFEEIVRPLVATTNVVPKFVFIATIAVAFGLTTTTKVVLAVSLVVFIFYYYSLSGMKALSPAQRDALTLFGAKRAWIIVHGLLPAATLYLIAAFRAALPTAFTAVVFAEIWMGSDGLGAMIAESTQLGQPAKATAAILVAALIGWAMDAILRRYELATSTRMPSPVRA